MAVIKLIFCQCGVVTWWVAQDRNYLFNSYAWFYLPRMERIKLRARAMTKRPNQSHAKEQDDSTFQYQG